MGGPVGGNSEVSSKMSADPSKGIRERRSRDIESHGERCTAADARVPETDVLQVVLCLGKDVRLRVQGLGFREVVVVTEASQGLLRVAPASAFEADRTSPARPSSSHVRNCLEQRGALQIVLPHRMQPGGAEGSRLCLGVVRGETLQVSEVKV